MKTENKNTEISRKEAIAKMGKYAALTAVGTFAILTPIRGQSTETSQPVGPAGSTAPQEDGDLSSEQTINPINSTQVPTSTIDKNQIKNSNY